MKKADGWITDNCPTAPLLWAASRIFNGVSWRYDREKGCYQTHQWSRDAFYSDVRDWPADTALSSLLRAVREDERLADPIIQWLGLYIAFEYVTALMAEAAR